MPNEEELRTIIERLAKLEQKSEDLEEFVKNNLLHRIDNMEKNINNMERHIYERIDCIKAIVERRFKWIIGLIITFFVCSIIPLIITLSSS